MPLPHYIRKGRDQEEDRERYQTIFARKPGAIAAPTAGLHFSGDLFKKLQKKGISWCFVTLHVGEGTFAPLKTENIREHSMHSEWCELLPETATTIAACHARRAKVVAVGTTCVRLLESAALRSLSHWRGRTELFIYPPYQFRVVDALITNFHLPRSTLLLLVAAFAGVELIREAYSKAIEMGYRFYSYGDAMLIL
jgi:S-adenosylmethionine:tRNA ribosyltransferase-isomerase